MNVKSELRDARALGWGRYVYLRFVYRAHMRLIHPIGLHWWRHIGPVEPTGATWKRCDWCGAMKDYRHGH